ncbi:bifunctional oligoribonuclease/PAP phosphatase NrnA [Candidatus Oleimmundimicrobium sp.]|uniref:DHH family phosphoesterase n=1 Tax=Candidatus Oleimmundimicrobium sp. TaxID=3060597 RepID=UPI002726C75E|nr:bifunctional oligoribonuclease/PAP phosphatase NrnA [Candidatus Oleimmundimicrobium sp.]MDO8885446.1 bifunctional oligoribonuclease/PAP phosphatase NrnA [Candidatus Oleimmundimicrobium sp.]
MKRFFSCGVCSSSGNKEQLDDKIALISKVILEKKKFILSTHTQPDGDAIGSVLGLGLFLKKIGKSVFVNWGQSPKSDELNAKTSLSIPKQYSFLPGLEMLSDCSKHLEEIECFIALDCANLERLGCFKEQAQKSSTSINIDHHPGNDEFAQINCVDKSSPATTELIYKLIKETKIEIDRDIATCLYVGLVTDTGRFQYSNANRRAFQMAMELLDYGVIPAEIFHNVYETTTVSYLKLLAKMLKNLKIVSGVAYATVTQKDLISTGAKIEETESLIEIIRSIENIKVAIVLKETRDGKWKVSLRSKNEIDVSKIAGRFGGGGHRNAAGYLSEKNQEGTIKLMLEALKNL